MQHSPDNPDKLIVPSMDDTVTDDLRRDAEDLEPPSEPPMVPHIFSGPIGGLPLAIVADMFHDETGTGWVALRIETVYGSAVYFMHPDVAENLCPVLTEKAAQARVQLVRPGDN